MVVQFRLREHPANRSDLVTKRCFHVANPLAGGSERRYTIHNVIIDCGLLPPEGGVPRAQMERRLQAADASSSDTVYNMLQRTITAIDLGFVRRTLIPKTLGF